MVLVMVNRTIFLVALFAWISVTTVAQGTYTIDTIIAIIPISERNNLFLYRGSLILFFSLYLIWLRLQMISVLA